MALQPEDDLPLVDWGVNDSLHRVEEALHGVLANFPAGAVGWLLKRICFPFGRVHAESDDRTGHRIAMMLMSHNATRDRLIHGIFKPTEGVGAAVALKAFDAVLAAEEAERTVVNGMKRQPTPVNVDQLAAEAVEAGLINEEQARLLIEAQRLSAELIAVDEFDHEAITHSQFGEAESPLAKAS